MYRHRKPYSYFSKKHEKRDSRSIEQQAIMNTEKFEGTIIQDIYTTTWRLVSIDGIIVGTSPFPDGSVILTMHATNVVLHQLYDYLTDEKERMAQIPLSVLLPKKGKAGIDYFFPINQADIACLFNYVAFSAIEISDELKRNLFEIPKDLDQYRSLVRYYHLLATYPNGTTIVLWPAVYWSEIGSKEILLVESGSSFSDPPSEDGRKVSLAEFRPLWPSSLFRGQVRDFVPAMYRTQQIVPLRPQG
jgi:hypothetical protein